MNLLEKISPGWALKRAESRQKIKAIEFKNDLLNYAKHGASQTSNSFKNSDDNLYTADESIGDNKDILMARSRDNYTGNPIALGAIRKIRTNVVGTGIKLKSKINNKILKLEKEEIIELQSQLQMIWNMWAESKECDSERQSNFYQLQSLAIITQLVDGECFILLPLKKRAGDIFDLKIRFIDSARCMNPASSNEKIRNGVEINDSGEPIAYYFLNNDNNKIQKVLTHTSSGRKNILVLMEKERIGQRRGIPLLSPVLEILHQLTKYTNAELMNAVVGSMFTAFIKEDSLKTPTGGFAGIGIEESDDGEEILNMGYGTIAKLKPGQDLVFANPTRPTTAFDNFLFSLCKEIGTALEIPVEVLLSSFNASYSASKASLEEVWKMYKMRREWISYDFCQPVYEQLIDEAVMKGYIDLPDYFKNPLKRKAYLSAEWYGQAQGQIDPLKEAKASVLKVTNGFSTRARESRELNGSDVEDNINQLSHENKLIEQGGLKNVSTSK